MPTSFDEYFDQDTGTVSKFLSFEQGLFLFMVLASISWWTEYQKRKSQDVHPTKNKSIAVQLLPQQLIIAETETIEIPSPPALEEPQPTNRPLKETRIAPPPAETPPVKTEALLDEALHLYTQPNDTAQPEQAYSGVIFDRRLNDKLKHLRDHRQAKQKPTPKFNQYNEARDASFDLLVKAGNGCIFRQESSGLLKGTWYIVGCETDHIKFDLPKIPLPGFDRPARDQQ